MTVSDSVSALAEASSREASKVKHQRLVRSHRKRPVEETLIRPLYGPNRCQAKALQRPTTTTKKKKVRKNFLKDFVGGKIPIAAFCCDFTKSAWEHAVSFHLYICTQRYKTGEIIGVKPKAQYVTCDMVQIFGRGKMYLLAVYFTVRLRRARR